MNRDKLVCTLVLAAIGLLSLGAAHASATVETVPTIPTVSAVLPSAIPVEAIHVQAFERPAIQTTSEVTIYGSAPTKVAPRGKVWKCSEPRALATDASATVKECAYFDE